MNNFAKFSVFAILALGACTNSSSIKNPPVEVGLKNGAVNQQRILGVTEPVVRTFVWDDSENENGSGNSGKKTEIIGATCTLDSAELQASFTTPAIVRIPKFAGKPTTLRVKCQKDELKTDFQVKPQLDGALVAGPSVAGLVAAAVSTAVALDKDSWSYGANDVSVWIPLKQ